jgi:drug/metabolite transporter (DMT)-like permease
MSAERAAAIGLALGFLGVLAFSLTLPMTRIALRELDPWFIGLGRALVAALPAAVWLAVTRARRPSPAQMKQLARVALGVIVGFPVCSSLGLQTVPAAHGAVVIGVLPLATAVFGAWLGGERPSRRFWWCAMAGSALVIAFALTQGAGRLSTGDLWLLAAVVLGAFGYAEGGRLAREMGGAQVICWALVLAAPLLLMPVGWLAFQQPPLPWRAATLGSFIYVALVSQWLGFFAWYRGLALGGVARVGQVQLLQVFLTIAFSALVAGETVSGATWWFALAVAATIVLGRRGGYLSLAKPDDSGSIFGRRSLTCSARCRLQAATAQRAQRMHCETPASPPTPLPGGEGLFLPLPPGEGPRVRETTCHAARQDSITSNQERA